MARSKSWQTLAFLALPVVALGIGLALTTSPDRDSRPPATPGSHGSTGSVPPSTATGAVAGSSSDRAVDRETLDRPPLGPSVVGRLVGTDGRPIHDAEVAAVRDTKFLSTDRTDARGAFALELRDDDARRVDVRVVSSPGYQPGRPVRDVAVDGPLLELTLKPTRTVRLTVVDSRSERPVEEFAVRVRPRACERYDYDRPRQAGHHPGGQLLVGGLWDGDNLIAAVPTSAEYASSELVVVDPDAVDRVTVPVDRVETWKLRVTRSGVPVPGVRVALIDPRGRNLRGSAFDPAASPLALNRRWARGRPLVVSSAVSTESGEVRLAYRRLAPDAVLRVMTATEEPLYLPTADLDDEIRLPAFGLIRGRVLGSLPDGWTGRIRLTRSARRTQDGLLLEPDHGGRFERERLLPGHWSVSAEYVARGRERRTILQAFELGPGERREITVDLGTISATGMSGTVSIDGRPARGEVSLLGSAPSAAPIGRYELDEHGRFHAIVPAGRYVLRLEPNAALGRQWPAYGPDLLYDVASGSVSHYTFAIARRSVHIRVRHADGSLAASIPIRVRVANIAEVRQTDHDGVVTIECAPPRGTLRVETLDEQPRRCAEVELDRRAHHWVDATLPEL